MKFMILTSCYLLLLFILISSYPTTTFGAHRGHRHHPRGHSAKHRHRGIKCYGYRCFPAVRGQMSAMLTKNSFEKGGDGGGPSECDGRYHSDDTLIVALSTGWYHHGSLCHKYITIHARNGRSTRAMVVDECDVSRGCRRNIVDGSRAVWKALGVPQKNWGLMPVTWSF